MEIKSLTKAEAKGNRSYMEDTSVIDNHSDMKGHFLGVFDGHGGDDVSMYCEGAAADMFALFLSDGGIPTKALFSTVERLSSVVDSGMFYGGSTASMVYIPSEGSEAYVAVIGDSPVIVYSPSKGVWFGPDHNVRSNPEEMNAAVARGGHMYGGYICNARGSGLQMGRALGDPALRGILSRIPEVFTVDIEEGGWILVGTDGLFDPAHQSDKALKNAVDLINNDPSVTAQTLVDAALDAATGDNVTAILVRF